MAARARSEIRLEDITATPRGCPGMTAFKDHFSGHAADYAAARPGYPDALFDWLAQRSPGRGLAWDAGCGNGQAALALAARFGRVHASDASAAQIASAVAHPRIRYQVAPAQAPDLPARSVDLVTVAQAWHWFDRDAFHGAVREVARPGAVLAVWCYGICTVSPAVDAVFERLYEGVLGPYWPPERRHVEAGYGDLSFPFAPLPAPPFAMACDWDLPAFLAYLRSWSASQRHLAATGRDAVAGLAEAFAAAWGAPATVRTVRWPLALRAGRVDAT